MSESSCIVCYRECQLFSVGACDHSVCFECSARMRVLLQQNECPICRKVLETVIFTKGIKPYKECESKLTKFIYRPQHGIYLENDSIEHHLEGLLEHRCGFCQERPYFNTFDLLKTHVQRNHDLFCCDLCSENIKHFSKERRFYTRSDLAYHKRKGDKNDKSHRGHPLCQFCDRRYFDSDDLFKHLRKDHYYCHFCDADGMNFFYNGYDDLRVHFRCEHFLCEEENCKDEQFTSVFRSEIDLKAHLTTAHSRMLGKLGTKQARVVDLQFAIAPRSDDERRTRRFAPSGRYGRNREQGHGTDKEQDEAHLQSLLETVAPSVKPQVEINTDSAQDFPSLDGAVPTPVLTNGTSGSASIAQRVALSSGMNVSSNSKSKRDAKGPVNQSKWNAKVTGSSRMEEEFPALDGPTTTNSRLTETPRPVQNTVVNYYSQPRQGPTPVSIAAKPSSARSQPPSKLMHNKPPNINTGPVEEFPSLGSSMDRGGGGRGNAWVGSSVKMKPKSKLEKVNQAPVLDSGTTNIKNPDNDQNFQYVALSTSKSRKDPFLQQPKENEHTEVAGLLLIEKSPEKSQKKKKARSDGKGENSVAKAAAALFNGGNHHGTSNGIKQDKSKMSKATLASEEFPSLPLNKTSNRFEDLSISRNGNGIALSSDPPPGFQPNVAGFNIAGPPPGFSEIKSPVEFPNNELFSNIDDRNGPMSAVGGASNASCDTSPNNNIYIQPPSFTDRNQRLFESIRGSLNADSGSCELFRIMSNQYRKGEITSNEYYELCQDMFGTSDFRVIFPELLALLPNIQRQQELLSFHRTAGGITNGLMCCNSCGQVVKSGDISAHMRSHNEEELFPALRR